MKLTDGVSRRQFAALLSGAPLARTTADPQPVKRLQTTLDLYPSEPRASAALIGNGSVDYSLPGSAASASGRALWWGKGLAPIAYARWLLIWNPQGDRRSGVRVQSAWNTPTVVLGEITGDERATPITSDVDVTAVLQQMQQAGVSTYVYQTIRESAIVFASTLEIVWDVS